MTLRYAHLSPVHKREAMEILGSRIKSQIKAEDGHQMDTKVPYEILPIPNQADLPSKEGRPSGLRRRFAKLKNSQTYRTSPSSDSDPVRPKLTDFYHQVVNEVVHGCKQPDFVII